MIVKHANPCGVAVAAATCAKPTTARTAPIPTSAFGGIIAFNRPLDARDGGARSLERQFVEVIVAPAVDAEAREVCARKDNVRLLVTGGAGAERHAVVELRSVNGGLLVQTRDRGMVAAASVAGR